MEPKILIADDSNTIQRIVAMAFENEHAIVEGVGDGQKAFDRLPKLKPDAVLADIDMPGLNGFQLSKKIKSSAKFKKIRVLLLASDFEDFDKKKFKDSKADDYITKPFKSDDIVEKIKKLLPSASWEEKSKEDNMDESSESLDGEIEFDDSSIEEEPPDMEIEMDSDIESGDLDLPMDNVLEDESLSAEEAGNMLIQQMAQAAKEGELLDAEEEDLVEETTSANQEAGDRLIIEMAAASQDQTDESPFAEEEEENQIEEIPVASEEQRESLDDVADKIIEEMAGSAPTFEPPDETSDDAGQKLIEEMAKSAQDGPAPEGTLEEVIEDIDSMMDQPQPEPVADEEDSLFPISIPDPVESLDELDEEFANIANGDDIKPEPDDLLESVAPSVFSKQEASARPDLIQETLTYLSDFSDQPEPEVERAPDRVEIRKHAANLDLEEKTVNRVIGDYLQNTIDTSLNVSIQKEITGLSEKILETVREIAKEVTPDIVRDMIKEEIEKIKQMEEV